MEKQGKLFAETPAALVPVKHVSFMNGSRVLLYSYSDRAIVGVAELGEVMGVHRDTLYKFISRNPALFDGFLVDVRDEEPFDAATKAVDTVSTVPGRKGGGAKRLYVDRRGALMLILQVKSKLHVQAARWAVETLDRVMTDWEYNKGRRNPFEGWSLPEIKTHIMKKADAAERDSRKKLLSTPLYHLSVMLAHLERLKAQDPGAYAELYQEFRLRCDKLRRRLDGNDLFDE